MNGLKTRKEPIQSINQFNKTYFPQAFAKKQSEGMTPQNQGARLATQSLQAVRKILSK